MDADDRIIPNGLRTLYDCYLKDKPHPDMVIFRAYTVDKYYDAEKCEHIRPHEELFRGSFLDYVNTYGFGWGIWSRLISREFLLSNNVRFEPFSYGEDNLFVYTCLSLESGELLSTNLDIYRYCIRKSSGSDTRYAERNEKVYYDLMGVCKRIKQLSLHSKCKKIFFEHEVNGCQVKAFTCLVYTYLPYKKVYTMLQNAREGNFFPIATCTTRWHKVINLFVKSPLATYLLSIPTRYIFLPYIKPRLHRN